MIFNIWITNSKFERGSYSTILISDVDATNPVFTWLPSQLGCVLDFPHLHKVMVVFPSTWTIKGPFSSAFMKTLVNNSNKTTSLLRNYEKIFNVFWYRVFSFFFLKFNFIKELRQDFILIDQQFHTNNINTRLVLLERIMVNQQNVWY